MNNKSEYEVKVTEVRVKKLDTVMRAKAMASVVLNDSICINDIRVIEDKEKGTFIAMPSRKLDDGSFKDIAHPINKATREKIKIAILEEYNKN